MSKKKLGDAIITGLLGALGSMAMGFIMVGLRIFTPTAPTFQFVAWGVVAAILFVIHKFSTMRNFLFATLILFLIEIIWLQATQLLLIVGRLVFYLMLAAIIHCYRELYDRRLSGLRWGKFLALGGVFGSGLLLISAVTSPFVKQMPPIDFIQTETYTGLLIGLGLGIGFEIAEGILKKRI